MPTRIINLRRAHREAQRKVREAEADANRRRFGRSKAERQRQDGLREQAERFVDAHRRDVDKGESGDGQ